MNQPANPKTNEVLAVAAAILLRCFVIAIAIVALIFLIQLLLQDWLSAIFTTLTGVNEADFQRLLLNSMVLIKVQAVVFFLAPYAAIKLYLRKPQD